MPSNEKSVYLTFDDGPIPQITEWVLDLLKEKEVKASFFCIGNNVKKHNNIFKRILDEGHSVGNHTYDHLNGWSTHTPTYLKNALLCEPLINTSLFRPPYGRIKKKQLRLLSQRYKVVMWDVLSGDFDKKASPEQCFKNIQRYTRNGSILVFHDSIKAWSNLSVALPKSIDHLKEQGYTFKAL